MLYETELSHHGIKGQKWGVRRYQNEDGTLTRAGKKRYARDLSAKKSKMMRDEKARLSEKYDLKGKETEIRDFKRRHYGEFDMNDGSGATTIKAKANANRYMKMNEEYEALSDKISIEASKNVADKFLKKYGQDAVKTVDAYESKRALKTMAVVMTLPFAALAVADYSDAKKKKQAAQQK